MNIAFLLDVARLSFKALSERKLRSALTILGIAIGPLALVMMTSVVEGYADYVQNRIEALGQNLIVVTSTANYVLRENDVRYLATLPHVVDVVPFYMANALSEGGSKVFVYATDIDFVFRAIPALELEKGSIPGPSEASCAVVGHDIAYDSSGNLVHDVGDAISVTLIEVEGGTVKYRRISVAICGILKKFGGALFLSPDSSIYLPLDAGRKLLKLRRWSGLLVLVDRSENVLLVEEMIREHYSGTVNIISFQGIARIVASVSHAMNFITFTTSLSAFAVAIAGVAATMITSVVERVREIGVLKAIGFTNTQVLTMILFEGIVMSVIGAAIGISLGVVGAYLLASKGFRIAGTVIVAQPRITLTLVAKSLAITILVGIAGALLPAYKASKIPPAVALRYE